MMTKVFRFHHPLRQEMLLTLELPTDTLLRDVTARLYEEGFVAPKRGGYQYIIDGRLASQGHTLACYLPESCADGVDVYVRNLLIS